MRMDIRSSKALMKYIKTYRDTVIVGSAASKTQVIGTRPPRDIDITVKDVSAAKHILSKFLKTKDGKHRIDIHGFEMGGKAGRYHRFGFETKTSIKLEFTNFSKH